MSPCVYETLIHSQIVTDRLAYLNFVQGSLASSLAVKLDAARAPLKALRDAETALAPRRNVRAGLHTQLARLEHDQQKGMEKKILELKDQISKAENDDLAQEKEIELLKRKAVRESETLKWDAIREASPFFFYFCKILIASSSMARNSYFCHRLPPPLLARCPPYLLLKPTHTRVPKLQEQPVRLSSVPWTTTRRATSICPLSSLEPICTDRTPAVSARVTPANCRVSPLT